MTPPTAVMMVALHAILATVSLDATFPARNTARIYAASTCLTTALPFHHRQRRLKSACLSSPNGTHLKLGYFYAICPV